MARGKTGVDFLSGEALSVLLFILECVLVALLEDDLDLFLQLGGVLLLVHLVQYLGPYPFFNLSLLSLL